MNKEWRQIPNFPAYHVSNYGEVFSFISMKQLEFREVPKDKHLIVNLYKNKRSSSYLVHRLVLETFIGLAPINTEASHLDGNPKNNRLDNLIWETRKENHARKVAHGTHRQGEKINFTKLNEQQVKQIRELGKRGIQHVDIAPLFNISPNQVGKICHLEAWKHVK